MTEQFLELDEDFSGIGSPGQNLVTIDYLDIEDAGMELLDGMGDLMDVYDEIAGYGGLDGIADPNLGSWLSKKLKKAKKSIKKAGNKLKSALKKVKFKDALPIVAGAMTGGVGAGLLLAGKQALSSLKNIATDPDKAIEGLSNAMGSAGAIMKSASAKVSSASASIKSLADPEVRSAVWESAQNPQANIKVIDTKIKEAGIPGGLPTLLLGGLALFMFMRRR